MVACPDSLRISAISAVGSRAPVTQTDGGGMYNGERPLEFAAPAPIWRCCAGLTGWQTQPEPGPGRRCQTRARFTKRESLT